MGGLKDCHTKWDKSDRNIWYFLHAESKEKLYKWTYSQNRSMFTDSENEFMVTRGEVWGQR